MSSRPVAISVVVCTRDRPEDLGRCLDSLAALNPAPKEVIVVDQGLSPFPRRLMGSHLRHERTPERGLSHARNRGSALAREAVVAFLDDDCVVAPGWAAHVVAAFDRNPEAAVIFGAVVGPGEQSGAYVPTYSIKQERRLKGRMSARRAHGIGAAMYMRLATYGIVGPFDPRLGAGADFHSSEDWDYTFRALAAGLVVVETPSVEVMHFGARTYANGSAGELLRRNAYSHGAVHAKVLRCFDPMAMVLIVTELAELLRLIRPQNVFARRPTNANRLLHYTRGLLKGLRAPVQRKERLFAKVATSSAP